MITDKTPPIKNNDDKETSAYRSYQRRELQKSAITMNNCTNALTKFSSTIELLTSNKINKSNAFENRLIDIVSIIFQELARNPLEHESVWQKYSAGIDSCGKIWGLCVDFVHTETIKVLGGLSRTGNIDQDEEKEEQKQAKRKKPVSGGPTLEKDIKNITTDKFERFEHYDSYFKLFSSKFDASTSSGLLINQLPLNANINIPMGEESALGEDFILENPRINIGGFENLSLEILSQENICEGLNKFENKKSQVLPYLQIMEDREDLFTGIESEETGMEEQSDDEMLEEKNLLNNDESYDEDIRETNAVSGTLQDRITNFAEGNDYTYFNKPQVSYWGGFEYMKNMFPVNVKKNTEKKQRKVKEVQDLILNADAEIDFKGLVKSSRKNTQNGYACPEKKWKEDNIRVPFDYGFTLSRLTQLFSRPRTMVKAIKQQNCQENRVIVEDDNESQSEDPEKVFFAENIDGYLTVNKEENAMKYSVTSKTVDIKKLKHTIKENLNTFSIESQDSSNPTFFSVINSLPSLVPQDELSQLSIHSCFITILHLANEHNYILEKTGACDFLIKHKFHDN
ncbi:hypothetical protein SteCoe_13943 [Stentor coeruleus]|uniref:Condensin complex subunit 2 n=1 Tax=Stentor coeruleus TaxID=5963 RepID=A0A1R2C787_9CILI|nr:hypothetical protein SteCoe_13943 [Stentor coeruleus]